MLTGDRNTTETETSFAVKDVVDDVVGGKDDRVGNEAVLVPLYGADHSSLRLSGLIVMDNANASKKLRASLVWSTGSLVPHTTHGHCDSHVALSDGIHWAGHERGLESDVPSDFALCEDDRGREINLSWQKEEVVVG